MSEPSRRPRTRASAVALTVLGVLAAIAALRLAADLLIPLVLSVLVAFALAPVVRAFERLALSRVAASVVVVIGSVLVTGGGAYTLSGPAIAAAERLPEATTRIRLELRRLRSGAPGPLDAIERAADDIEAAAAEASGARPRPAGEESAVPLGLRDGIVLSTMSVVSLTGEIILLVFFVFFLLASGDLFRRKLVRLAGPALAQRRITVAMLDDVQLAVERFLAVTVATNATVAVASAAAFLAFGLANPLLWAAIGGTLNTVPYLGSAAATVIFFAVALLQFDEMRTPVLIAGTFLAITSLEGMWLKPCLMSRTAEMNNVAIFLSLLFWAWLWGPWGMLLAYPIMMVIKAVADHTEPLRPVGELLGT